MCNIQTLVHIVIWYCQYCTVILLIYSFKFRNIMYYTVNSMFIIGLCDSIRISFIVEITGPYRNWSIVTWLARVSPPPAYLWCIWSSWRLQIRSFCWSIAGDPSEISDSALYCECDERTGSRRRCRLSIWTHTLHKKIQKVLSHNFKSHIRAEKEHRVCVCVCIPKEARSEYWELSKNRSTPICCPEQSRANFL